MDREARVRRDVVNIEYGIVHEIAVGWEKGLTAEPMDPMKTDCFFII